MRVQWLSPRPSDYTAVWRAMQDFTAARTSTTADEIWLTEHTPVYTLGQAGRAEHVLNPGSIPVVHSDRGGQVTYHGPGQVVAYVLFDLKRAGFFIKEYVHRLEEAVIATLRQLCLHDAQRRPGAPGVYVPLPGPADSTGSAQTHNELAKIAALGIKVRNGCTYHGVALNVAMDLTPFQGINPCGYAGLRTVDLATCGVHCDLIDCGKLLASKLSEQLAVPVPK